MPATLDLTHFSKNYLVRGLSPEQIDAIAALGTTKKYSPLDRIITAGTSSAELYVILSGTVRVHLPWGDKLAEPGPGSVIGEMALIDAQPRSADVICVTDVEIAVFDAQALRKHLNSNKDVGFTVLVNLAQVLCGRLRDSNAKIEFLGDADLWKHAT
ncbi:MAG TPA: cyclic nucleotide-binding domain-containing protein [Fimbriimonadaceae bacterium]|nr:cyclic nucleotide-binding domain-containing protein [Fimbriimonadaceae bacterium]